MKKYLFLIIFILLLQTVIAEKLSQGESITIGGREIKIIAIQESKVIISVDDEKTILTQGQLKEISGIEITVTEIFSSQEISTVTFTAKLTYICGDNICNPRENSKNCCKDCKCEQNQVCSDNNCIIPECTSAKDCNDNNELTEDYCSDFKCNHREIKCKSNTDCNDNNPDTDDLCDKGRCKNIQNYICKTNEDCNDDNPCTTELCVNRDCQYKPIENCKEIKKEIISEKNISEQKTISQQTKNLVTAKNFFKNIFNWFKNIF